MGPLAGTRIVEIAAIGPAPHCAMLLADLGAEVVRIDRVGESDLGIAMPPHLNFLNRGRRSLAVDLKHPEGIAAVLRLVEHADALIEGMRPGVMERLGLGPDRCLARNPRLVYGRVTGWGQDGPLAPRAGHDIDYVALSGALGAIGPAGEAPVPPLNLVGDFGGGALYLAVGVLAALLCARQSGAGQVVDAAMLDGAAHLTTIVHALRAAGAWDDARGCNVLDGGAPYYRTYETRDGKYLAVGAIEARFYGELLEGLGLSAADLPDRGRRASWPALQERFASVFRTRTRAEWTAIFADTDACVAPVLDLGEVARHPHNAARRTFVEIAGHAQPGPAPRFSRSVPDAPRPPVENGADSRAVLAASGFSDAEIASLIAARAVYQAGP